MKPANVLLFLLLIFVTYIGGFVSGVKKIFPYDIARQIKEQIEKRNSKKNSGLDTYEIKKITFQVDLIHCLYVKFMLL